MAASLSAPQSTLGISLFHDKLDMPHSQKSLSLTKKELMEIKND
tara:strand:+ start:6893 stop:7024 length:132 start_codon:yes stop_codon:yes gene_type:complete